MRNDLPSMGPGRAAAQASHAANAFWQRFGHTGAAKEWASTTPQGFGTAIVLGATLSQIDKITDDAGRQGFGTELVIDPDYAISFSSELFPYIKTDLPTDKKLFIEKSEKDPTKYILHREEITCGYIFGDKELLQPLLGDLPLYS